MQQAKETDRDKQYTYPERVAFFKALAETNKRRSGHADFGYWELDNATTTTIREMIKSGELRIARRDNNERNDVVFIMIDMESN